MLMGRSVKLSSQRVALLADRPPEPGMITLQTTADTSQAHMQNGQRTM